MIIPVKFGEILASSLVALNSGRYDGFLFYVII